MGQEGMTISASRQVRLEANKPPRIKRNIIFQCVQELEHIHYVKMMSTHGREKEALFKFLTINNKAKRDTPKSCGGVLHEA